MIHLKYIDVYTAFTSTHILLSHYRLLVEFSIMKKVKIRIPTKLKISLWFFFFLFNEIIQIEDKIIWTIKVMWNPWKTLLALIFRLKVTIWQWKKFRIFLKKIIFWFDQLGKAKIFSKILFWAHRAIFGENISVLPNCSTMWKNFWLLSTFVENIIWKKPCCRCIFRMHAEVPDSRESKLICSGSKSWIR